MIINNIEYRYYRKTIFSGGQGSCRKCHVSAFFAIGDNPPQSVARNTLLTKLPTETRHSRATLHFDSSMQKLRAKCRLLVTPPTSEQHGQREYEKGTVRTYAVADATPCGSAAK